MTADNGLDRFVEDAAQASADGLIVPDLPPEEAGALEAACRERELALVYLAPPNAAAGRLALLAERTAGFLYLVSVRGVTGVAHTPVAVGFGISTPAQAAAVGRLADGVIVGSALVNAIDAHPRDPAAGVFEFVGAMARAMRGKG